MAFPALGHSQLTITHTSVYLAIHRYKELNHPSPGFQYGDFVYMPNIVFACSETTFFIEIWLVVNRVTLGPMEIEKQQDDWNPGLLLYIWFLSSLDLMWNYGFTRMGLESGALKQWLNWRHPVYFKASYVRIRCIRSQPEWPPGESFPSSLCIDLYNSACMG